MRVSGNIEDTLMELSLLYQQTLKISGKKGYVLFNPQTVEEATIVILDDNSNANFDSEVLIIYGPGEFEAGGVVVKGSRPDASTIYEIDNGEGRALHVLSDSISKLSDEDDFDVIIIKAISPVEEAQLSTISSGLIVLYGEEENIPEKVKENKVNKISLRKKDELPGNIVYLVKK